MKKLMLKDGTTSEIVDAVMNLISDSPSQISDKTGMSKTTIWRIVHKKTDPTTGIIEKIMKAYDITWVKVLWRMTSPKGATNETKSN